MWDGVKALRDTSSGALSVSHCRDDIMIRFFPGHGMRKVVLNFGNDVSRIRGSALLIYSLTLPVMIHFLLDAEWKTWVLVLEETFLGYAA